MQVFKISQNFQLDEELPLKLLPRESMIGWKATHSFNFY